MKSWNGGGGDRDRDGLCGLLRKGKELNSILKLKYMMIIKIKKVKKKRRKKKCPTSRASRCILGLELELEVSIAVGRTIWVVS